MFNNAAAPGMAQAHVELRRARILAALRRRVPSAATGGDPLPPDRAEYLRCEAEDLFWNELSWEQLTDEELISGGHLTELVFPAFLAFVDGLLVERVPADSLAPPRPHPGVVEDILMFLGERYVEFTAELENGADSERLVWARAMTARLIDLVLYRRYRLTHQELEEVEALA